MPNLDLTHQKRILIVDDEPAVAQLLRLLLGTHGYQTEIVSTSQEALNRISPHVDLILLDLLTPDFEGFKICQRLKVNTLTCHIPIIILSGKQNNHDDSKALYFGADDYLTKPFEPEELFAHIESVLHRHHVIIEGGHFQDQYDTLYELRRIIDQESIVPFFQPIYFLSPMRLFGVEALSRPQTSGPMANPEVLFKSALRFGVYFEIEMIGWRKAIEMAKPLFDGHQHLFLNCNPYLVECKNFRQVRDIFHHCAMPPNEVFLEITERSAISEQNLFYHRIQEYRRDGFKIAVDDVGGGYSSLESIVETKPDVVKLDRHLVSQVSEDLFKRSIVKLVVAFCRESGIICVAEGIESKKDLDDLIDIGVDAGQGFFLGRPTATIDMKAMQAFQC